LAVEAMSFKPASVGNVQALAIKSEWRWEWRMRKYTFGIEIRKRGKNRDHVMYISKTGENNGLWQQFLPEYERWQSTGFKRRSKYARVGNSSKSALVNREQDSG
jgi:hypothetical protein